MTSPVVDRIRAHLHTVALLRAQRQADPVLAERVRAVKTYQARRFEHTYSDLLASPRYRGAARFFLEELYGPQEFADRDTQFARVVPALVRIFPQEVVHPKRAAKAKTQISFRIELRGVLFLCYGVLHQVAVDQFDQLRIGCAGHGISL